MRLIGSYLDLTDRVSGRRSGKAPGAAPAERQDATAVRTELLISVAKRLVRSAVRRNTVKRVVREAWRAATDNGIAQQGLQAGGQRNDGSGGGQSRAGGASVAGRAPDRTVLVRLKRYPGAGSDPKQSLTMIKRSLRKDADQLFATLMKDSASRPGRPPRRNATRSLDHPVAPAAAAAVPASDPAPSADRK